MTVTSRNPCLTAAFLICLPLAGCVSNPSAHVSEATTEVESFVNVRYVSLTYADLSLGSQSKSKLTVSATVQPVTSKLAYKYSIASDIEGDYFLMPNPPVMYTVIRTPFYDISSNRVRFSIDIHNDSGTTLLPERAIATVDIRGQTIFEKSILLPKILPNHHAEITIDGPLLQTMIELEPSGEMQFGVYEIHAESGIENFWWNAQYVLAARTDKLPVTIVVRTPREAEAIRAREQLQNNDG